jgi:hypothetical protein
MHRLLPYVICGLVLAPKPAHAECAARFEGEPRAGSEEYDPFEAVDFRRRQTLTVRNIGTETCDLVIAFHRQPKEGRLGQQISYRIEDASGQSLLTDRTAFSSSSQTLTLRDVAPTKAASTDYYLVLPRGQSASPGVYHDDNVQLALYARGRSAVSDRRELEVRPLQVAQPVKASVNINIAGGGLHTTLGFDELITGKERTVAVQARSNNSYNLRVRSENGSVLKLASDEEHKGAQIPYSLRVNAQPVSLSSPVTLRRAAPQLGAAQESHLLTFRIEDAADRRAGLYRDVITIEISVAP